MLHNRILEKKMGKTSLWHYWLKITKYKLGYILI